VSTRPLALVIDDSDDTRDLYAVMLRLEGFAVAEARDGQEGVAKAVECLPAIIVTDLSMPIIDGCETIRDLKADARTHHIPIIACSGLDLRHETRECSADAVLTKPCPADQLLLEVRALLRRGAAAA
jgi:DNA-binding response OmpR family regulator